MSLAVRRTLGFWVLWLIGSEATSSDGNGLVLRVLRVLRLNEAQSLQSHDDNNGHAFITRNKAEQSQVDFVSVGCSSSFKWTEPRVTRRPLFPGHVLFLRPKKCVRQGFQKRPGFCFV
ncbi:hypothetical protein EYF80_057490 [Liparis tanakae]|uniref:Secreted protein n=1 Tax=Liparis tanakae TaxID=230148 RepID=A0A4Z2EUX9_9TELE|nr:hypothetical protein EYF80_057490 [Liparis tanakae]